jgi:hypothetical protein
MSLHQNAGNNHAIRIANKVFDNDKVQVLGQQQ